LTVEASALRAPASLSRLSISAPLLRLRSDDQLLALFRAGSDEAFNTLHDRYRQRLFAYVRQMLATQSRQDAEDVLQDVFVRAFGALRADERQVNVRAWLYRVAHNRCIDHLRRPMPAPSDVFEMSRTPLHDPLEDAQRREDLRRLVTDVGRLPEQQRSALLMREIDGMSYADLATALDVTVPAVKSLLVRARLGLVEAAEARTTDCAVIREDLVAAYDRGVKASGRARRHMKECEGCREYRAALRGVRSSFAALSPGAGAAALAAKFLGVGGGGAAAGSAAAGGGGAAATGAAAVGGATACKVAAIACAAALTAGGAVEVTKVADHRAPAQHRAHAAAAHAVIPPTPLERRAALSSAAATAPLPVAAPVARRHKAAGGTTTHRRAKHRDVTLAPPSIPIYAPTKAGGAEDTHGSVDPVSGGVTAPVEPPVTADPVPDQPTQPLVDPTPSPVATTPSNTTEDPAPGTTSEDPAGGTGSSSGTPGGDTTPRARRG
jgi:RNA polymerase sigma factor (sigma-70 family)